ncbi:MAG TPA: hydrogenase expression/formation protein HypE [Clostridia bacterium]
MSDIITLAHGSGGRLTHNIINDLFYRNFENSILKEGGDSAVFEVPKGRMAFSTDSYVITPILFRGGNIGKLAVCGTVNDLAVSGARPLYLSCGFIIEEGFEISCLETIAASMAETAREAGVHIVTGDTKVVQRGAADKIFINTSGIGEIIDGVHISPDRISIGDSVIITGTVGDHGTSILIERENFKIRTGLESDCCPLNIMLNGLCAEFKKDIHVLRDPTRGGVATTLNELVEGRSFGIKVDENMLPVRDEVRGVCEMLGLDPLYMANEGKAIVIVSKDKSDAVLKKLKEHRYGKDAKVIGEVTGLYPGKVFTSTLTGGSRIIDMLVGDQLPRIC